MDEPNKIYLALLFCKEVKKGSKEKMKGMLSNE
jgi:hypothetical protein